MWASGCVRGSGLGRGAKSGSALACLSRLRGPVRCRLLLPPGGLGCGVTSGLQHPRAAWAGGVGPLPRALCVAGTRLWLWQPLFRSARLRATCQAFSLGCPAVLALGSRGAGEAEKQALLVDVLAGCFPPLGPPWARFLLIDVVMSCSPGPGLNRVRRGTDIHGEWDRASRSARGSLAPPLLPPAVVGGVGGEGCGGVWAPARLHFPTVPASGRPWAWGPLTQRTLSLASLGVLWGERPSPWRGGLSPCRAAHRLGVLSAWRLALCGAPGAFQVVSGA